MLRSTRDSQTMRKSAAVSRAAALAALASDRHRLRHTRSDSPWRRVPRIRPTAALAATAHSRILPTVPFSPASGGGAEFGLAPAIGEEGNGGDRRPSTGHVFSRLAAGLERALPLARTATTKIERESPASPNCRDPDYTRSAALRSRPPPARSADIPAVRFNIGLCFCVQPESGPQRAALERSRAGASAADARRARTTRKVALQCLFCFCLSRLN